MRVGGDCIDPDIPVIINGDMADIQPLGGGLFQKRLRQRFTANACDISHIAGMAHLARGVHSGIVGVAGEPENKATLGAEPDLRHDLANGKKPHTTHSSALRAHQLRALTDRRAAGLAEK